MLRRSLPQPAQAPQLDAQHADDGVSEGDRGIAGGVAGAQPHAAAPEMMHSTPQPDMCCSCFIARPCAASCQRKFKACRLRVKLRCYRLNQLHKVQNLPAADKKHVGVPDADGDHWLVVQLLPMQHGARVGSVQLQEAGIRAHQEAAVGMAGAG